MDSRADGSAGATKRRILLRFYVVRFPNPTRVLSPRRLSTDHDHAIPTREHQSDQSSRLLLGCHRPCCPRPNQLQPHQQERVPAPPPVEVMAGATTVVTVQGFDAPKCGAPLTAARRCGRMAIATGRSGGNTPRAQAKTKTHQNTWGLTGRSISERQLQPELDQAGIARTNDRVADGEIGRGAASAAEGAAARRIAAASRASHRA